MNDIEPMQPVNETRHGGLLGLLRELGYAYIGAFSLAAASAGSLYKQCVARGEATVGEMQASLDERRDAVKGVRRQRVAEQSADVAAHAGRQVQAWMVRGGMVSRSEVARLTAQIDELSRELEALDKEDGQP